MNANAAAKPAPRVVVAGGANMDVLGRAGAPLLPCDSTPGEVHLAPGGVARNVAHNLAQLGQDVHLISAVGDDDTGRRLVQETAAAGVNVDAVAVIPGQRTASYVALSGPDGTLACAVNDMRVTDCLTPQHLAGYLALLQTASALVLDGNLTEAALLCLVQSAPAARVFADGVSAAKCTRLRPCLGHIHTLKLNRPEALALTGQAVTSREDAAFAAGILQDAGVQNVVISLGEAGVFWQGADRVGGHRAARATAVRSTNGAGDALLAGLVDGHLRGMPLAEAVAWGLACAEMTLASPGANAPALSVRALSAYLQGASPDGAPVSAPAGTSVRPLATIKA
jgi:pseudouridine kinase